MQNAQDSPEGIQANSARSLMPFFRVVSLPAIFTHLVAASAISFAFSLVFNVPFIVFATSQYCASSAISAGSTIFPLASAIISYILADKAADASPYFLTIA